MSATHGNFARGGADRDGGKPVSREDYVAVAVRLFSIYLLLTAMRLGLVAVTQAGDGESFALPALAGAIPLLGIAALLWSFPLTVARKLLPLAREPRPPLTLPANEIEALAFGAIGLWLLASALHDGVYYLGMAFAMNRAEYEDVAWSAQQLAGIAATVFEIMLGVALLLGARGLQLLLHRLRGRA